MQKPARPSMTSGSRIFRAVGAALAVAYLIGASGCSDDGDSVDGKDGGAATDDEGGLGDGAAGPPDSASGDSGVSSSELERWLVLYDRGDRRALTDPDGRAALALIEEVQTFFEAHPAGEMGLLAFGETVNPVSFTPDATDIEKALMRLTLEGSSDLQSSLTLGTEMIADERAQGYDGSFGVLLLMDGTPTPRCSMGCEDDTAMCADGDDNDGDGDIDSADDDCAAPDQNPDDRHPICNASTPPPEGTLSDWPGPCPSYNTAPLLISRFRELRMSLGDRGQTHARLFATEPAPAELARDLEDAALLLEALAPTTFERVTPEALGGSIPF